MSKARSLVGVDVGGTYTDLFFYDEGAGAFRTAKVSSRRGDEAAGFLEGLQAFGNFDEIGAIVHGTTVGTNALLERKGAIVGVITTTGFRDVLEMRRRDRPHTWGLRGDFTPVVTRDFRLEVAERTLADGSIRQAVDADDVRRCAQRLVAQGAQALAIIFINAYANPANERAAVAAARSVWPNEYVVASSEILPEIREFERASSTALNAYLQPVVGSYLARLQEALDAEHFGGEFNIVQSNGGVMSTQTARRLPIRTALSGPAAGVIAAQAIGMAAGFPNLVTGDLGGTSFDVSLVADGQSRLAAQTTIEFGLVIRTPMIEITTIGAGGGSIASVDASGLLQIGPESAGSVPGPVCFGKGNDRPTLTDANLILGRINGAAPIGRGAARLDVAAAESAILRHVGDPLGLDAPRAAAAIIRVANARMAGAIRLVSIERGYDPTRFAVMPFGGGGALHACALMDDVGLSCAVVPRFPGITSAMGCVIADLRHDEVQTVNVMLEGLDAHALEQVRARLAGAATKVVLDVGVHVDTIDIIVELDMHYLGQTHTIAVPLRQSVGDAEKEATLSEAMVRTCFEKEYLNAFGRLMPQAAVKIVNLRVAAIGRRPHFDFRALAPPEGLRLEDARRGTRKVWFDDGFVDTPIWSRLDLPREARIIGPAVLEQPDATIIVERRKSVRIDAFGNAIIERV